MRPRPRPPRATHLRLLGPGRVKLTLKFQGKSFRLTGVARDVITKLMA